LFLLTLPAPVSAAAVRDLGAGLVALQAQTWWWLRVGEQERGAGRLEGRGGVKPVAESQEQKQARVARLQVSPAGPVVLQTEQPLLFAAVPVDANEAPINGLLAEWESSNRAVVSVKRNGFAVGGQPGKATLTVRAGAFTETVQVRVEKGGEKFGGKKPDTQRDGRLGQVVPVANERGRLLARNTRANRRSRNHSRRASAYTPPPLQNENTDPLPTGETGTLYQGANVVGFPTGKRKAAARVASVTANATETNGNKNFTFAIPIVSLPGRGLNASLSLVYNSAVWHKSVDGSSNTHMTYDVDSGWPATGWRLGFGQLEDQGSSGFTLVEANGTRHALNYTSANNYDSSDGSFLHYTGASGWGVLSYPDGTQVYYGSAGGGYRSYPTCISDRNGNYLAIYYRNDVGPKLSLVIDTLGRYIQFYYNSSGDLVTITAPGLSSTTRQVMRFYYTDVTLGSSLFGSGITVHGPSSVHTLQYVYLPDSSDGGSPQYTGYKFGYATAYGMVKQITEYRGMTVTDTSTSTAGSVSNEGTLATQTTYSYPDTGQSFTDVPIYSTRTDEWAGRTTGGSAPAYTFAVDASTGVSTVTGPDGTINETDVIVNTGQWDDGLVKDSYVKDSSTTYSRVHMDWQRDSNNQNPRVYQLLTTDVPATLTKSIVLTYTSYNNVAVASERDFSASPTTPSTTELRRTETTFVTATDYINRSLLHLTSIVKVFPGGSSSAASRVDYGYDDYGSAHANLTARNDIIMHDPTFDPFQETQVSCEMVCNQYDNWQVDCIDWREVCTYYNPYNAATDYRGNVTSVTTYADAAGASGSNTRAMTYDIAGNVMTAQVDCCQQKSFTYSGAGSGAHDYAYVIAVTRGNPSGVHLTSEASYDYNTGLLATVEDENNQTTTNYYNSPSLRLEHIAYPSGGAVYFTYADGFSADAASVNHSYVETAVKQDGSGGSTRYQVSREYLDGRGAVARTMSNQTSANGWSTQEVEYDTLGRAYRTSNPYYASAYSATPLTATSMFWTTSSFDRLGRVTQVQMPRGDNSNTSLTSVAVAYEGVYTETTDQANKKRRQKVDALGRLRRLDEPTSAGLGTTSSPNQDTAYDYDVLDNLIQITQGAQHRYFMYDSLSRRIRERQVEQTTNSSYNLTDPLTSNSAWTAKAVYNASNLVTDTYDARGVHATYSYDDLNRLTTITYSDATPTCHYYYDSTSGLPSGAPSSSAPDSYAAGYAAGRLVAMTYGSGATGTYFGYDVMGRINQQFQLTGSAPAKYKLSYGYNYADMLTSETYPSGATIGYSFDEGGRLSQVSNGSINFAGSFQYEASGALSSETWGNSAVHTRSFNKRLQTAQVKLSLSGSVLQQFDYGYGAFNSSTGAVDTSQNTGQIGSITNTIGATAQWLQGFQYDELARLANVAEYQGSSTTTQTFSQAYTYDRFGNKRQSANSTLSLPSIASTDYDTTNNNNRFTSSVATYDSAGNITADAKFRTYTHSYDANGRTIATARSGSFSQTSTYDCAGQRVQTAVTFGGVSYRTMVYDIFGQLVADYNGSAGTTLESENVYRGGQLLARYNAGAYNSWTYVLADAQGTARTVMNNNGGGSTVLARHDYLPFGEEIAAGSYRTSGLGYGVSGSDYNRQRYALTERDDVTNLDHTSFRKYDSLAGRWTSPDPLGGSLTDPQSNNAFTYAANDPVNQVDPSGLLPCIWDPSTGQYCVWGGGGDPISTPDGRRAHYLDLLEMPDPGGFAGPGQRGGGPGGGGPGGAAGTTVGHELGHAQSQQQDAAGCDKKLAQIFGGPGSIVGSTDDPGTLGPYAGKNMTSVRRGMGHGPEPYDNPDPRSTDRGGIIHIYADAEGRSWLGALYTPAGGSVGTLMRDNGRGNSQINVSYNRGPYAGLTISFIHANADMKWGGGRTNAMGSVRIGGIGGKGGDTVGYVHTHIIFRKGGKEVDPRSIFCGEFGF